MRSSTQTPGPFWHAKPIHFFLALIAISVSTPTPAPSETPKPSSGADETWKNQFKPGAAPMAKAATPSPESGKVTYTLQKPKEPTAEEEQIFAGIEKAMEAAIGFYNRYTTLRKKLNVSYSPGTPTADGNINGSIRVGKSRNTRVLMHEIGHTMGVGQHANWGKLMVDHRWQGKEANKVLQELTKDPNAQLHGDHMHFWPYGLNYDNEVKSDEDLIRHTKIVQAMVKDLENAK
ncbi:MAG: hypothetical protein QOE70_1157 [Chthoniobacter sp.]|jgi:hypothetical protein|nr:hypothetical protein [Chthoniobacter sp.]